uniref:Tumor suppressor 2, mitochondrial calcium regulator n=2 Tax=Chelydra serpentina TaxID=8475 RepID=A0A8C3XW80_CHESE
QEILNSSSDLFSPLTAAVSLGIGESALELQVLPVSYVLLSPFLCSSMYYDEDGDLAHEFYEETIVTKNGRKRAKLKRIHKNLIPQGIVKLEHPRIHVDFPVIICEV